MLIIAKQDNKNNLYAIWSTAMCRFLGVNLSYGECVEIVMNCKDCSREDAETRVGYLSPFDDIAECIYCLSEPGWAKNETCDIKNAVRLIVNHYKANKDFRNAFLESIASVLKEIPSGTGLYGVAEEVADRIIGEE